VIDPRALQQHFRKVQLRQEPKHIPVPRIPDPKPLTAIEAIQIPEVIKEPEIIQPTIDTSQLQEELKEVTQALTTLKQSLSETSMIEIPKLNPVTITVPVSVIVEEKPAIFESKPIETKEIKPKIKKVDENPYGFSIPENRDTEEYNPYGYYSGPRF